MPVSLLTCMQEQSNLAEVIRNGEQLIITNTQLLVCLWLRQSDD